MVAVFSRPVNYISDLGGRITTAWKHGAMRGSRQASFLEGASGRVGFPALWHQQSALKQKIARWKTFTCISCHSENLVDYVPCVNMPETDPVAHDYSVESVQECGVQQLEEWNAQVAEMKHIHCIVCDLKRGSV